MKKYIFYSVFIIVPALFLYFYNVYLFSIESIFLRNPNDITNLNRILHLFFPLLIAIVLIFLSMYSLRFSNSKSFYIILTVCFFVYLVLSILPLFSNTLSLTLPGTVVATYVMNDFPWYAGYYGGTLLFGYFHKKTITLLVS